MTVQTLNLTASPSSQPSTKRSSASHTSKKQHRTQRTAGSTTHDQQDYSTNRPSRRLPLPVTVRVHLPLARHSRTFMQTRILLGTTDQRRRQRLAELLNPRTWGASQRGLERPLNERRDLLAALTGLSLNTILQILRDTQLKTGFLHAAKDS
jgi:hypothetical protein